MLKFILTTVSMLMLLGISNINAHQNDVNNEINKQFNETKIKVVASFLSSL
jgi:competence protein ComGC